jgi:hypothetical protein
MAMQKVDTPIALLAKNLECLLNSLEILQHNEVVMLICFKILKKFIFNKPMLLENLIED